MAVQRSVPVTLAAVALTAGAAVTLAPPAAAATDSTAPRVLDVRVAKDQYTFNADGQTTFTVKVKASDVGVGVKRVVIGLFDNAGRYPRGAAIKTRRVSGDAHKGWYAVTLTATPENVGAWRVKAFVEDKAGNYSTRINAVRERMSFAYRTRWVDFTVTSIHDGADAVYTARLQRRDPVKGWVAVGGSRDVQAQVRKPGTTKFVPARELSTSSGTLSAQTPLATETGSWRLVFPGTAALAPATSVAVPVTS